MESSKPVEATEAGSVLLRLARQLVLLEGEAEAALAADQSAVGATVPLASLRVHHPLTLHRVRASLREERSLRVAIAQRVLAGSMVWHVYRDESGALVMYDDYAAYLVALELGCQMVGVKILAASAS